MFFPSRCRSEWQRQRSPNLAKAAGHVTVAAAILLLAGCDQQERRDIRQQQERIAAEQAKQQRIAAQYAADLAAENERHRNVLAAETRRRKDIVDAETQRDWNRRKEALGVVVAVALAVGGVLVFVVYSIRRLGERAAEERTKRQAQILMAIEADPNLKPEHRQALYGAAIEAASHGGGSVLGYTTGYEGGAR